MSSSQERKQKRRKIEKKVRITAIVIALFLVVLFRGSYVFAKYYAENYQKAIAIATGVYFTANYAVASDREEFFESEVTSGYQGTDFTFDFEVRNYENNLLFNDGSVVIPYSLSFWLEGETTDANYTVTYNGETQAITANSNITASFSGHSIAGGKAMSNKYTITLKRKDGVEKITPVPIYVKVTTDEGSVVNTILRGKMVLSSSSRAENFIDSQQFTVVKDVADEDEKFAEIQKTSALTYEIITVGAVLAEGETTDKIKVAWDPTVLEIDLFDEAYQKWAEDTGKSQPDVDATSGWYSITIEAMPYSAETITFFRGAEFDTKITDMAGLNASINATKVSEE